MASLSQIVLKLVNDRAKQADRERIGDLAFQRAVVRELNCFVLAALNWHIGPSRRMTRRAAESFAENFQTV